MEAEFAVGDLVWIRPCAIAGTPEGAVVADVDETPLGRFYTLQVGGIRRAALYEAAMLEARDPPTGDWD